jgi:osmotically-inducible protein OsmY
MKIIKFALLCLFFCAAPALNAEFQDSNTSTVPSSMKTELNTNTNVSAPAPSVNTDTRADYSTNSTTFTSDNEIANQVRLAFQNDATFTTTSKNIEVSVDKGDVTLNGTVQNQNDKAKAEALAKKIVNVKSVINNLIIASG